MKNDTSTPAESDHPTAPEPETKMLYEVTCAGPVKIGGVLAWRTARLPVFPSVATAINGAQPGSLMLLGVAE